MSIPFVSLILPTHTTDIKIDDIDNDGQVEIVIVAKNNGADVPRGTSLFVYEDKGDKWTQMQKINLGKKATFWEVKKGIWGIDKDGIQNLYTQTSVIQSSTWLRGLGKTSPKEASFVHDLNWDGEMEFLLNSNGSLSVFSESGADWGSIEIPKIGSIREYSKTGGSAMEIAQRSAPIVVGDLNGDGLQDLFFLESSEATAFYSSSDKIGASSAKIQLPINVEPQYSVDPKEDLTWVEFIDINGDQRLDIVWQLWVQSESWFEASSKIGWALGNGSGFDESQFLIPDRAIVNSRLEDLDGDGDLDLLLMGTDLGLGSLASALVSQKASVDLLVSRFDGGAFQSEPKELYEFSLPIKKADVLAYNQKIDLNKDGKKDFLVVLVDQYIELQMTESGLKELRRETLPITGGDIYIGGLDTEEATVVIWKKGTVEAQIFQFAMKP